MRRRLGALTVAVAAVATALAAPFGPGADARIDREFRARARAFPIEPAPGTNERAFDVRPVSADAALASAPMGANGRAAVFDLGFIESQFPPPEESFARCDTVSPNVPDQQDRVAGPMVLRAVCTEGPSADVRADGAAPAAFLPPEALEPLGVAGGVLASRSRTDASGPSVVAEVITSVADLTVGPLHVDEIRFRARAEASGAAGSARAHWSVDAMAADVNGVPVVIGTDGVTVDDQQVPAPLIDDATRAVQEGFAASGYMDVRLVQPVTQAAEDGSAASVRGGALHVFLTRSDNPADREFIGLTLLGGEASVAIGATRSAPLDLQPFAAGAARVGAPLDARPTAPTVYGRTQTADVPQAAPGVGGAPEVSLSSASARGSLPTPSTWWAIPLVLALAGTALLAGSGSGPLAPARRRVARWWGDLAEGYLRG